MKINNASPAYIEYHAIKGSYGRVSYYVTKVSLRDAAENLMLAPQDALSFAERIQRVVNIKRVEKEIVPYLEHNELRFFNALVCILLPDSKNVGPFWDFEPYTDESNSPLGGLGKLKILKDVGRVVLDGQHRFLALQKYWLNHRDSQTAKLSEVDIAIVFVVVDELGKIGSNAKQLRGKTIEAVRNLFAVLNKTARSVDKSTLLLIDDSDIFNVMTRSLIEDGGIDESFVKWTGGENLQPRDVYFSTLGVIRDACWFLLRDNHGLLDVEFGTEEDRQEMMEKFYKKTPSFDIPLKESIPIIFQETSPFKNWKKHLRQQKVVLASQPEATKLDKTQWKELERVRGENLCYTVAGQKAYFRAIIDVFYYSPKRDRKTLDLICKRASTMVDKGLFSRKADSKNPFQGLLFDHQGRMSWAEVPVDLTRRILSFVLGSPVDYKSICADYKAQTDQGSAVLDDYCKRADSILK
jgi:DGQHR domain-containing protein